MVAHYCSWALATVHQLRPCSAIVNSKGAEKDLHPLVFTNALNAIFCYSPLLPDICDR